MPGPVFLGGDRLTLRAVAPDDYEFIAAHRNRAGVRRHIGQHDPQTAADVREMVEEGDDTVAFLPCVEADPVGYVWAFAIDDVAGHAQIGYWITESERGQGYATEAVDLLAEWAFVDRGLHRLQAHAFESNDASKRVLEKTGFKREGTLREHYKTAGEHIDAVVYGLVADEWDARPK